MVDADGRPVGIITQGDLIYKGGLPVRLGLLAAAVGTNQDTVFASLAAKNAEEIMSSPAITIPEDRPVTDAVDRMLQKNIKRMPVVDQKGFLVGMLSRLDIFRTVMKESPDWRKFSKQDIHVANLRFVSDIVRRDVHTVGPDASVDSVMRMIDDSVIQRVAVVDPNGRFLGLISDSDILTAFSSIDREGIWNYFIRKLSFAERKHEHREAACDLQHCRAADIMNTRIITIREDALIDEAMQVMTERGIKRLPILDDDGKFKGMISRDSLLRTGFGQGLPDIACPL